MDRLVKVLGTEEGGVVFDEKLGWGLMCGVEKLWINLWDSLWEICEKVGRKLWIMWKVGKLVVKVGVFHAIVEKFYHEIYTWNNRGKCRVLHSFHNPYYYYY